MEFWNLFGAWCLKCGVCLAIAGCRFLDRLFNEIVHDLKRTLVIHLLEAFFLALNFELVVMIDPMREFLAHQRLLMRIERKIFHLRPYLRLRFAAIRALSSRTARTCSFETNMRGI